MITLSKNTVVRSMSANHPPVAIAKSGDRVKFITMDCMGDQYYGQESMIIDESKGGNPATGPLYVEGAKPGNTLKVTVERIELPDVCTMTLAPELGVYAEAIPELIRKVFRLENNKMLFNEKLSLELKPMIGVIGVAPKEGEISNSDPGHHGGNMDCKRIEEGVSVYFPVYHEGALLSMGDVHALMGDGESCLCGAEVHAEVTVTVEVIKQSLETVMVVGNGRVMTIYAAPTLEEASFKAAQSMRRFLVKALGMSDFESCTILSLIGDMRINEVVDPLMCCRMEVPISLFEEYDYKFI